MEFRVEALGLEIRSLRSRLRLYVSGSAFGVSVAVSCFGVSRLK